MRVVVTGGTGFIGTALVKALAGRGDSVVVFTRSPTQGSETLTRSGLPATGERERVQLEQWTPTRAGDWQAHLDGAHAVVHLAGEVVVGRRQTQELRREAHRSRVRSAELLVEAIGAAARRPRVFIGGSAVGYYGSRRGAEPLSETLPAGNDALARLCVDWEAAAAEATRAGCRVVHFRTGIVLGHGGGALSLMSVPFKWFVGGPLGSGRQYVSWIHREDVVRGLLRCLDDEALSGPINATAPQPVTNAELSAALGRVLRRPSWLSVPGFALKAGLGEGAEPLLGGQRALPERLARAGFEWHYPSLDAALHQALGAA